MPHFPISFHASRRIAQRGVQPEALKIVLTYGDDLPTADGCRRREFRQSRMAEASADGVPFPVLEAALKIEAIISPEERLVTCYLRTPRNLSRSSCSPRRQDRRGRRF